MCSVDNLDYMKGGFAMQFELKTSGSFYTEKQAERLATLGFVFEKGSIGDSADWYMPGDFVKYPA